MIDGIQLTSAAVDFNVQTTIGVLAAAGAVGVGTLAYGIAHPRTSLFGRVISRGASGHTGVAITLDDGPTAGSTDRVLDTLGELNVSAAFFVIGKNALTQPKLVERIHREGHLVGNHTFEHSHTGCMNRYAYWEQELGRAGDAIEQIIGVRPALFRPPMGLKTWHLLVTARKLGLTTVTWNRRAWDTRPTTVDAIIQRLTQRVSDRDILLLHDGIEPNAKRSRDPKVTCDALKPLVQRLRERGLEPGRLDTLIDVPPYRSELLERKIDPISVSCPSPPERGRG